MSAHYLSLLRSTKTFMRFKVKIIRQMTTARANTRRYRKQPTYFVGKGKCKLATRPESLRSKLRIPYPAAWHRAMLRALSLAAQRWAAARPLARRYPPLSARWHRCGAAPTLRESLSWQKRWSDRRFHVFVFSFRAHVLRVCQIRLHVRLNQFQRFKFSISW